jgi:hypothetical protein
LVADESVKGVNEVVMLSSGRLDSFYAAHNPMASTVMNGSTWMKCSRLICRTRTRWGLAHRPTAQPLPPAYGLGDGAKPPENLQNSPVAALHQLGQDGAGLNESEKQFSFTRAALSTSGRAKNQIPINKPGVSTVMGDRIILSLLVVAVTGCASPKANQAKQEAEKVHQRGWIGGEFELARKVRLFGSREDYVPLLPPGLASSNRAGILITALSSNSPACQSGLLEGDLILDCAHRPVTTLKAFHRVVDRSEPGKPLPLTIWREGRTFDCAVPVGRETFKRWLTFGAGVGLPNLSDFGHLDLWPNPGFDLWVLGFEPNPNDRKELGSAEAVYSRGCQKGKLPSSALRHNEGTYSFNPPWNQESGYGA